MLVRHLTALDLDLSTWLDVLTFDLGVSEYQNWRICVIRYAKK